MSSSAPRRLAVLRSHLRPDEPAAPTQEHDPRPAAPAVSTLTCAGGGGGEGCVFCRIIRGDAPAYKIYEDDVCLCILDSHPLAPGHSLIIPKCHFSSLEATPPPVAPGLELNSSTFITLSESCVVTCNFHVAAFSYCGSNPSAKEGDAVVAAMCSKVPFLSNAIMKATECDSFNLVVNNGAAAGQVIFHTHFHIIPRRSGDKLWPTESFRRCSIEPNETSGLVSCIKEQLCSTLESSKVEAASLPKES